MRRFRFVLIAISKLCKRGLHAEHAQQEQGLAVAAGPTAAAVSTVVAAAPPGMSEAAAAEVKLICALCGPRVRDFPEHG